MRFELRDFLYVLRTLPGPSNGTLQSVTLPREFIVRTLCDGDGIQLEFDLKKDSNQKVFEVIDCLKTYPRLITAS